MNSFVVDVTNLWGVPSQVAILSEMLGFVVVVTIARVRLLHKFCCKYLLLVSVNFLLFPSLVWETVFGLLAGLPFASFLFADSDSWYVALSIVNYFNVSASASNLSKFSLINIAFALSICVFYVWLKVSAVTLWASKVMLWASEVMLWASYSSS